MCKRTALCHTKCCLNIWLQAEDKLDVQQFIATSLVFADTEASQ